MIGHNLVVSGEVDLFSAPRLAEAMRSARWSAESLQEPVDVDLSLVTYFDDAGLAPLLDCLEVGLRLRYRAGTMVEKSLEVAGLDEHPRVHLEPSAA